MDTCYSVCSIYLYFYYIRVEIKGGLAGVFQLFLEFFRVYEHSNILFGSVIAQKNSQANTPLTN